MTSSLKGKSYERLFSAMHFYWLKNHFLRVLIGCNRQLLLIKIYVGILNILKTVHHLLKLRASNKAIKQILLLLFLNFLTRIESVLNSINKGS